MHDEFFNLTPAEACDDFVVVDFVAFADGVVLSMYDDDNRDYFRESDGTFNTPNEDEIDWDEINYWKSRQEMDEYDYQMYVVEQEFDTWR